MVEPLNCWTLLLPDSNYLSVYLGCGFFNYLLKCSYVRLMGLIQKALRSRQLTYALQLIYMPTHFYQSPMQDYSLVLLLFILLLIISNTPPAPILLSSFSVELALLILSELLWSYIYFFLGLLQRVSLSFRCWAIGLIPMLGLGCKVFGIESTKQIYKKNCLFKEGQEGHYTILHSHSNLTHTHSCISLTPFLHTQNITCTPYL